MLDKVESGSIVVAGGLIVLLAELLLMQQILLGVLLYSMVLTLLLLYGTFRWPHPQHHLLVLAIPAVIRLMAYTLPLGELSPLFAQLVISVPLGVTAVVFVWLLEQDWPDLRFEWRLMPYYLLLLIIGAAGGLLLYQFQQPMLPVGNNSLLLLFYAFVLVAVMAFLEEWLFRGIMQTALTQLYGNRFLAGLVVAFFYTILSLGQGPWPFVLLIFILALALSWLRPASGNLMGVGLMHGAANLTFFLILPNMESMSMITRIAASLVSR